LYSRVIDGNYLHHIHRIFLDQLPHETDAAVVCSNLRFQIGDIILEASGSTGAWETRRLYAQHAVKLFLIEMASAHQQV
jgi:predicted acetyltransferase